jgi:8-oxo-dGTP pyrophosphatase MutT (NUDIX family)
MITSEILEKSSHPIRIEIQRMTNLMRPFDLKEMEHLEFVQKWIATGAEIFRIAKPATPDPHLVSYFVLIDEAANKILLVDHKKAGLWLPPGGHVELNEHPKETVRREIFEELRIQADFISHDPLFVTVTKTVGQTAGHTDVTLWYILRENSAIAIEYDQEEFNGINWFDIEGIPYEKSDPHMERFVQKLLKTRGQLYEH